MESKLNHLQMLQAVIARMAGNSFLLKGWSITVVSALLALAADKPNVTFVCVAFLPAVMFWALDGYFLRQERLFRQLYDRVRVLPETEIDFTMNTQEVDREVASWVSVSASVTLLLFHGTVLAAIILSAGILVLVR